jgi:hypothetical protein
MRPNRLTPFRPRATWEDRVWRAVNLALWGFATVTVLKIAHWIWTQPW